MDTKLCFKCGLTKERSEFYPHPMMADGLLGKCKECARRDTTNNRRARIEYYDAYDKTPQRRENQRRNRKRWRVNHPDRVLMYATIHNAVRDGRIKRQPCIVCGAKAEGHHDDYSKPFEITWLCFKHHRELKHGQWVRSA